MPLGVVLESWFLCCIQLQRHVRKLGMTIYHIPGNFPWLPPFPARSLQIIRAYQLSTSLSCDLEKVSPSNRAGRLLVEMSVITQVCKAFFFCVFCFAICLIRSFSWEKLVRPYFPPFAAIYTHTSQDRYNRSRSLSNLMGNIQQRVGGVIIPSWRELSRNCISCRPNIWCVAFLRRTSLLPPTPFVV